jgi:hypothetical protein
MGVVEGNVLVSLAEQGVGYADDHLPPRKSDEHESALCRARAQMPDEKLDLCYSLFHK